MRWGMRTLVVVIAAAVLACVVVIAVRPDEPLAAGDSAISRSPSFQVRVEKPPSNRALAGLFGLIPSDDLTFDQATRGAGIGWVAKNRLQLRAEGWDLSIEIDGDGRVSPTTRLVFPSWLRRGDGPRPVALRCRPAARDVRISGFKGWRSRLESWDKDIGHLRINTPPGASESSGDFLVEVAICENVESGKAVSWPNAPLTVRGRFDRLKRNSEFRILN